MRRQAINIEAGTGTAQSGRSHIQKAESSASIHLNFSTTTKESLFCHRPFHGTQRLQFGSDGDLRDWVCRIQAVCAREANDILELALLMGRARRALPHGGWSELWRTGEMPFSKRKGEMLVAIGKGIEGLNANNCARLPAAWRTLYYLTRLGRETIEQLISQGRIHPGLSLQEAKELLAEYRPESRRATSRSKLQVRLARFAAFIRTNLGAWSQQDRKAVAHELEALAWEIQAANDETAAAHETGKAQGAAMSELIAPEPKPPDASEIRHSRFHSHRSVAYPNQSDSARQML